MLKNLILNGNNIKKIMNTQKILLNNNLLIRNQHCKIILYFKITI